MKLLQCSRHLPLLLLLLSTTLAPAAPSPWVVLRWDVSREPAPVQWIIRWCDLEGSLEGCVMADLPGMPLPQRIRQYSVRRPRIGERIRCYEVQAVREGIRSAVEYAACFYPRVTADATALDLDPLAPVSRTLTWEPPAPVSGVTITGYILHQCIVPDGSTSCQPLGSAGLSVPPSPTAHPYATLVPGETYCATAVTVATGGQAPTSQASSPPACEVIPLPPPVEPEPPSGAPLPPQNLRATVP